MEWTESGPGWSVLRFALYVSFRYKFELFVFGGRKKEAYVYVWGQKEAYVKNLFSGYIHYLSTGN